MNEAIMIAGVDEVGRGSLAGPVVAAAVILNQKQPILGLADSKKLKATRREELFSQIIASAIAHAIGCATVEEIDKLNIFQATLLAMQRAVNNLTTKPNQILVDGTHCPQVACAAKAIIRGDQTVAAIQAASIIAKVSRDREMLSWHDPYPEYGFGQHKGYGTKQHLDALTKFGLTPIHRRSFRPVSLVLAGS